VVVGTAAVVVAAVAVTATVVTVADATKPPGFRGCSAA